MSVSISGHYFKDSVVDGEERDVESATTQIKHEDVLLTLLLVQTIRNSSSSSE